MVIKFRCHCGASYDLKEEYAGRVLYCPQCGSAARVPAPSPPAALTPQILATTVAESPLPRTPAGEAPTITADMLAPAEAPPQAAAGDGRMDFEKDMPLAPRLTLLLIVANIFIFFVTLAKGALESKEAIILAGALSREHVLAGEVWRLVSAMFLHGGFDHLFGNCVALYILGMACEHAFGLRRIALLYFFAGLGGSIVSVLLAPGPSVGASGAIFGLMGGGIVFFRRYGKHFIIRDNRVGIVLIVWAAYSILTGFLSPFIDNGAHLGGLLSGALVALALHPALLDRLAASAMPAR